MESFDSGSQCSQLDQQPRQPEQQARQPEQPEQQARQPEQPGGMPALEWQPAQQNVSAEKPSIDLAPELAITEKKDDDAAQDL